MKRKLLPVILCLAVLLGFSLGSAPVSIAAVTVEKGQMGEISLTSTNYYENKFDVTLSATFTQGGTNYNFYGFYSGGNTWKIRFNLPLTGNWTYTVTSSDAQLNHIDNDGSVTVNTPSGGNKGCLVKDGRRVKWENTGETFLSMGNTAWWLSDPDCDYEQTIDWMSSKGFNLILWDLDGSNNGIGEDTWFFGGTKASPVWDEFNLTQWDRVDSIIQYAAGNGIVSELGTGLVQHWKAGLSGSNRTRYYHYIAARLGAYPGMLYYGPVTEYDNSANDATTIKSMCEELSTSFHRRPLMGMHPVRSEAYYYTGGAAVDDSQTGVISYTGTWDHNTGQTYCYRQTNSSSCTTNNNAILSFNETAIRLYVQKGPGAGKFDVYIDDVFKTTYDGYSSSPQYQVLAYENNSLSSGTHTIKVVVKGEKNPSSSGYWVNLDYFKDYKYSTYVYHEQSNSFYNYSANYTGQAWLTLGTFHESNMFDGFGILQHRYQSDFNMPLFVHEGKYEKTDGTLANNANQDIPLEDFGIKSEINNNSLRYYRWYTWGSLLSGGSGITYGLSTDCLYGYPINYTPTGYQDIRRQLDYYLSKGFSPNACENKDVDIDNAYTTPGSGMFAEERGLKRPKMLKDTSSNKYLIYNPYDTNLTIKNVPSGSSIEIFNPTNGNTYSGGTTGSSPFTFNQPTQFSGEYVLCITPSQGGSTIVDDSQTGVISYTGTWDHNTGQTYCYNQTNSSSCTTNNNAILSFTGTSIKLYVQKGSGAGKFDVYIDDVFKTTYDGYASPPQYQVLAYENNSLSSGTHAIKVVVKGEKNPSSSGYWVNLDYFEYN